MSRAAAPAETILLAPLPPVSRVLVALALTLARWEDRRRSRQALALLDGHLLRDIGLTQSRAADEVGKPFWAD
jgi:uncharacterized protein YjiS (DUF1127 family)